MTAMTDSAAEPVGPDDPASAAGYGTADAAPVAAPFFERADWLSFALASGAALAVYLLTLAPEVTLEYSGLGATAANYGGVTYPPGFPVWTLYSWLFVELVPFSNVAWRVAAGSAVAAALACGLVALMVSRAGAILLEGTPALARRTPEEQRRLRIVCGFVAGMALGLSRTVWRVAVVAEVWAPAILLFTLMLGLFLRWVGGPLQRRYLYAAAFVFGLLLTGNQELLVAAPALLWLVISTDRELGRDLALVMAAWALAVRGLRSLRLGSWPGSEWLQCAGLLAAFVLVGAAAVVVIVETRRFGSAWKPAGLCLLAVLLGLACYLYLPLASMTNPPVNWSYDRSPEGFIHGVRRRHFEGANPTHELGRFVGQIWSMSKETGESLGWPYLGLAILPFGLLPLTGPTARVWLLGLTAVFVCVGPLLLAELNPTPDRASVELVAPYFAAMLVVLALLAGLGLMVLGSVVTRSRPPPEGS